MFALEVCFSLILLTNFLSTWSNRVLQAKYKYAAWEKISHVSAARAQALYIQEVNKLIEQIGTRDA